MQITVGAAWDSELIEMMGELLPGHRVVAAPTGSEDLLRASEVVVPFGLVITGELLEASRVRLIQQFGVGVDSIDLAAAGRLGIFVANAPARVTGMAGSVAEHALFLLFSCLRWPPLLESNVHRNRWNWTWPLNPTLAGKTVGIIGFGDIGQAVAERLQGFQARVLAVRRSQVREKPSTVSWIGTLSELPRLLAESDFIIITAPLNAQSYQLLNTTTLNRLKAGACIVNVGRGAIIDEDALLHALAEGRVRAAGLDTLASEPPSPDSPLLHHPRVLVTPHVAGVTDAAFAGVCRLMSHNIASVTKGEAPRNWVNKEHFVRPVADA